jgi:hypothetical protein
MPVVRTLALVAGAALICAAAADGAHKPKPRIGQPCQRGKQYPGFLCRQINSSARPTLFKIARPGPAPSTCATAEPTPQSIPPGSISQSIDLNPVWVRPDVRVDAGTSIWRTNVQALYLGGWPVKWLWQAAPNTAPIRVSITDLTRGGALIAIHGSQKSRTTTLDSGNVLVEPANSWSSYVLFPGAGCYRLDATWQGGTHSLTFAFGR